MGVSSGVILAATQSRSGKTTMTLALMAHLAKQNIPVAPFKAGPDYLDGAWHQEVSRRPSYNLDTFMLGNEACRTLYQQKRGHALGVVEGVMGLYDGKSGVGGTGSTADLARVLGLPVLLVVNVRGMAGSLVPLVQGFAAAAQGFTIAGILANQVGSTQHAQRLSALLDDNHAPPLLGWMGRHEHLTLEERHLGLTLPGETSSPPWEQLAAALHLDQERFNSLFQPMPAREPDLSLHVEPLLQGKTIAVARDAAFSFIYTANLECLEQMGATVHFFSPLAGDAIPDACSAIWLPGGYPELHAEKLSQSRTLQQLTRLGQNGTCILAECGGMMALGEHLVDLAGRSWPMAGLLPMQSIMTSRLAGLGYRQEDSGMRGHEFHHSIREASPLPPAFSLDRGDPGLRLANVRASYVHWYFPSAPRVLAAWLGGTRL
ncbi:MAG: cobyrinate a,c-diamide synthase [Magnetococcales bacterium]|nr:cobyrinate a,c-diamide synthase [Magnetococcales bacterium]